MNSTINTSSKNAYHTFANVEFTGVFDRIVNNDLTYICYYHLFIKYGDIVYIEVKDVGEIVISFAELLRNRYLKYYYDLSLLLTNNKNIVSQDLKYSSEYNDYQLYEEPRFWSIDTASIENDILFNQLKVISYDDNCYYKINPYDLVNMEYTSPEDLNIFETIYMMKYEFDNNTFENIGVNYYNLVSEYKASLIMKKEVEELTAHIGNL
jgi:hypothetical protein